MISYAQNGEDVVLDRAFKGQESGFYIDVGAADPTIDSVTRHFYDRGWRGINIDPLPLWHRVLEEARPGDINLQVGISSEAGEMLLHVAPGHPGGATLAGAPREAGGPGHMDTVPVELVTLAEVCRRFVGEREIDFLKVDVEGHELAVIQGADWKRWRPRVVLVEATEPNRPVRSDAPWAALLLEAGYLETLFDGLNRFFVRAEDSQLAEVLSAPANVFDDYVPYSLALRTDGALAATRRELEEALARLRALEDTAGRPAVAAEKDAPFEGEEVQVTDYVFDREGSEPGRAGRVVKPLRGALRRLQRPWFDRQVEILYELRHSLDIQQEQLKGQQDALESMRAELAELRAAISAADGRHWDREAVARRLAALEDAVGSPPTS